MSSIETINVVVVKGGIPDTLVAFPNTDAGYEEASKVFIKYINQIAQESKIDVTPEVIEEALDNEYFTNEAWYETRLILSTIE